MVHVHVTPDCSQLTSHIPLSTSVVIVWRAPRVWAGKLPLPCFLLSHKLVSSTQFIFLLNHLFDKNQRVNLFPIIPLKKYETLVQKMLKYWLKNVVPRNILIKHEERRN